MICGVLIIVLSIVFVLCGGGVPDARMMYYDVDVEEEESEEVADEGENVEGDVTAGAEEEFPAIQFNPEEDVVMDVAPSPKGKPASSLADLKKAAGKQDPVSSDFAQNVYDSIRGGKL